MPIFTALGALAMFASLSAAPMQCSRAPDADTKLEDQPGDALWSLANKFRTEGKKDAADETLRELIDRYPSDRHTPEAREILEGHPHAASVDAGS